MSHKPQRFEVYTQLPDGSGFTIANNPFVFKYDRNGGWQDQYGNHYNSDGTPNLHDRSHEDSEEQRSEGNGYDDFQQFDREYNYGKEDYDQDGFDDEQIRNLEKIQINNEILKFYPEAKPLRIYFNNMDYTLYEGAVLQKLRQYTNTQVAIKIQRNEEGLRNGRGYFVVSDKSKATEIINLEGKKFGKRNVYFEAETIEELAIDPIQSKYLRELEAKTGKSQKKQLVINRKKEDQPKKVIVNEQQKLIPPVIKRQQKKTVEVVPVVTVVPVVKTEQPIKQIAKEQLVVKVKEQTKPVKPEEWLVYCFDLLKFKNGDEFRNWTKSFNIVNDTHYRNTKKLTDANKKVCGTLQAPEETIKILRSKKFGEIFLEFTKKE